MEPSPEYWTLHDWLFKAWMLGMKSDRTGFRPFGMCMIFGPDWRQKECEMAAGIMAEMIADDPALKQYALTKMMESSER